MYACSIVDDISTFVIEDHILDWHSCQICYPLEINKVIIKYYAHLSALTRFACSIVNDISIFVIEDHMLDWHSCQICYPLEINKIIIK